MSYVKTFRSGEGVEGIRYHSGRQTLDEALIDGRLVRRYMNCTGQVVPEYHITPQSLAAHAAAIPGAQAFRLGVNGEILDGGWKSAGYGENMEGEHLVCRLALEHEGAGVAVTVVTRMDGGDFIIRNLEIENRADKAIALTSVAPFSCMIWAHGDNRENPLQYSREEVVGKGAAFELAYNHLTHQLAEGDFYFDQLYGGEKRIGSDRGKSGFNRPACWLRNRLNGETLVCEYAYAGNWQMVARVTEKLYDAVTLEAGMMELEGEAVRVLVPGESVVTPAVHFALLHDSDDRIVQLTHMHVRKNVLPRLPAGVPIAEIEANHRGYLCDRETEEGLLADIDVAAKIGTEMYVVDAGWYGAGEINSWWNNTGDWVAGPWLKNGFEPIPKRALKKGLRFGLWIEIEAAGAYSRLREEHPEWIARRNGAPCAKGRALDLALPEVEAFCLDTICGCVERYGLDMYRIDHNHSIGLGATRIVDGFVENTLWRYYEAFERIHRGVMAKYPRLVLQNCAGGGGRLDWQTMGFFHNTELTDWMRQPRSIRILSGVTMSLPPEILLRTFGTEVGEMPMDGDLDSQFRICMMCRPIYRGIAPSVETLTPALHARFQEYNGLYRSWFRPQMENCLVYHHTPFQPVREAAPMTILEYASPDKSMATVAVFTLSPSCESELAVKPRGVDAGGRYRVTLLNSDESYEAPGAELRRDGIPVRVGVTMSSEMALIQRI
jgi:alpha-galactosidase